MILKDVKLDADDEPRSEGLLVDFVLGDEVLRLLRLLDEMSCGTIRHVEVRAGIPRRIVLESRAVGANERLWECPQKLSGIGAEGDRKSTRLNSSHLHDALPICHVEVRAGIPRRIVLESRAVGANERLWECPQKLSGIGAE